MKYRLRLIDFRIALAWASVCFWLYSCSSTKKLLNATGVRQTVYRQKTDLLFTELHYPITNNLQLDNMLSQLIWQKYQNFRSSLEINSLEYLNRDIIFTYRITFDVLRSPTMYILSFVLYETWESQESQSPLKQQAELDPEPRPDLLPQPPVEAPTGPLDLNLGQNPTGNSNAGNSSGDSQPPALKLTGQGNKNTRAEVVLYSLKLGEPVPFTDIIAEPLLVFERLAESCLRQLKRYVGEGNFKAQGVQPNREYLRLLSIGKSGIQVSFPPGQVMSPQEGVINILVPWQEAMPQTPDRPWQYGIMPRFRPWRYRRGARN